MTESSPDKPTASATYENWLCFTRNEPSELTVEAKLYTDCSILGELRDLGPYSFINTIAHAGYGATVSPRAAVALRVTIHASNSLPKLEKGSDFAHYHGGDFLDEIAALTSLFLGIRAKAGPVDREFEKHGDPLGRPIQYGSKAAPQFPPSSGSIQIPRLKGERNLVDLEPVRAFPQRTANQTNVFIKAARAYQQAVWIADADPVLAWLLLITAVETAAVSWAEGSGEGNLVEQMQLWRPDLVNLLTQGNCAHLVEAVAEALSAYTRSTKKFVDFLVTFAPPPPEVRPKEFLRFPFEPQQIKKATSVIYSHRSANLHNGTAFPLPMCNPPSRISFDGKPEDAYQEIPVGLAMGAYGATWQRDQTPMLLHTFEYLARGALLSWWKSLEAK